MRLVNDDSERPTSMFVANLVEDEGELLDCRDDDLFASLEERSQVAKFPSMADDGSYLGELLDGITNLLVEDSSIGNDDDRIECCLSACLQADQLVCQPGN